MHLTATSHTPTTSPRFFLQFKPANHISREHSLPLLALTIVGIEGKKQGHLTVPGAILTRKIQHIQIFRKPFIDS